MAIEQGSSVEKGDAVYSVAFPAVWKSRGRKEAKTYRAVLRSYARQAPYYDWMWRHYNSATVRATAEAVPWRDVKCVLDVGCGTGLLEQETQRLQLPIRIIGADISWDMLRQAQRKAVPMAGSSWINAKAEELPFGRATFDAVICANCFHYFRQPLAAANEFLRVLRPGGWLVVTDWCDDYLSCKVCDWLLRVVDGAHFRMYSLRDCQELLTAGGFQVETARKFKIDWLWGLMTLRCRAEGGS